MISAVLVVCCGMLAAQCDGLCTRGETQEGEPCGAHLNDGCATGAGPCCDPSETPGCADDLCEGLVCAADSTCCTVAWDATCAELVPGLCGWSCAAPYESVLSVSCADVICGTLWSTSSDHDEDWFRLDLEAVSLVEMTVVAELDVRLRLFLQFGEGEPDCEGFDFYVATLEWITPPCVEQQFSICLSPGTWLFSLTPFVSQTIPCGSANGYRIAFDCRGPCETPECGDVWSGSCFVPHPSPACTERWCCDAICAGVDPICCVYEWDGICAAVAYCFCSLPPDAAVSCDRATPITGPSTPFNLVGSLPDPLPLPSGCDATPESPPPFDGWFAWTADRSGMATVSTCDDFDSDTLIVVYEGPCESLTAIACEDETPGCGDGTSALDFACSCGVTYLIRVAGNWGYGTLTVVATSTCIADLTSDGMVDGADLGVLLGDWGSTGSCSDLDASGTVDGADLAVMLGQWGACY